MPFLFHRLGDNSSRIQRAIDYVSSLALDKNGFVGLFCWIKELFELNESLRISVSGVVLPCRRDGEQAVLLKREWTEELLLYIEGRNGWLLRIPWMC